MSAGKIIGGIIGIIGAILILNVVLGKINIFTLGMSYVSNWIYWLTVDILAIVGCIIAWSSEKKASGILLIIAGVMAIAFAIQWYLNPVVGIEPYSIFPMWIPALSSWPVTLEGIIIFVAGIICIISRAK